jgi:crotonobetainyl-CoA:carnitine CoA-transferase CaiB-like acyl-CoA transferase
MADADVVLENFLGGALARLGLDAEELLDRNPSLIWCTISGFGPDSARPGYDFVIQAECGWMAVTGERDESPMKSGIALADVVAGKDAAIAILAAVAERASGTLTREKRRISISLADSARAALVNVAQNVLVSGKDAVRWGNAHPNLVPYQLFDAADRPFVVAVGSDNQWRACARSLGLDGLADDPGLETNAGRVKNRDRIVAALSERVLEMGAQHWIDRLQSVGVPCGLVRSVAEALAFVGGSPLTGVPPSVPGKVRLPPPKLDEHGRSIRDMGWRAFQ